MADKLVYKKLEKAELAEVAEPKADKVKMQTFVEDAPALTPEEEEPRVIIYDRSKISETANEKPRNPVLSAQTKMEMEAGARALRRLQGLE